MIVGAERDILAAADGGTIGGYSDTLWSAYDLRKLLQPMAQSSCPGANIGSCISGLRSDIQMIDSSSIRVHQNGGIAQKR